MDSLYLLIPLSLVLVLAVAALLVWAVLGGQFDDLDGEGRRILEQDDEADTELSSMTGRRTSMRERGRDGRKRLT